MNSTRRDMLKAALLPLLLPLTGSEAEAAAEDLQSPEIQIIQAADPTRLLARLNSPGYEVAVANATLAFLFDAYSKGNMPVWKKSLSEVDMGSRIHGIATQAVASARVHASIYPVDPCWIMGQIMTESFFNEFAVSAALAVGPCQFIAATGRHYGLICADDNSVPPEQLKNPELRTAFDESAQLRSRLRTQRSSNAKLFGDTNSLLRRLLNAQVSGIPVSNAAACLDGLNLVDSLQEQYAQARDRARDFIRLNLEGRSIFNHADIVFFEQFEQRVLYHHSVNAMVRMMAEHLRARKGNILAATAGYNAGLGNTDYEWGIYADYGRIPSFGETVNYVSKIVINHYEISRRI